MPLVVTGPRKANDPVHSAESFLKLRTNLQFMDIDNPPRVIVVTSPLPGDGKSTVAMNLAAALSMSDRRVVLIDGDLRRPVLADSFGLIEGLGLTDVLIGSVQFEEVAQQVGGLPNLLVLAAGRVPPNPSEMLGSKAMRRLLERLAEDYTVIVDAPPLLPVTDAAVLTASADGALVVVSAGQTLDTQLRDALTNLQAVQGHTLGVVLNRVSPRSTSAGYYSGSYGPREGEPRPRPKGNADAPRAHAHSTSRPDLGRRLTACGPRLGDMLAVYAASQSSDDPLSGLEVGERPDPEPAPGWTTVTLKTAGLNHHDLWSLQGVGLPADRLPMILGCDGAGVDEDGNEVIVHAVVASEGWRGDETLDPRRTLLSELHDGTLAEKVARAHAATSCPSPRGCRGSTPPASPRPGSRHTGCSSPTPACSPARPCSCRAPAAASPPRWCSSARPPATGCGSPAATRPRGPGRVEIGADRAFASGERLPERVDAVMETVGAATWSHSVNSLKPGGTIVICGATSGDAPAEGRADQDLLPAAARRRLDHGHPRASSSAWRSSSCSRGSSRSSTRCCRWSRPARASPGWSTATCSARSSSRSPEVSRGVTGSAERLSASGPFGLSNRRELCKCDVCFNNSLPNHGHS